MWVVIEGDIKRGVTFVWGPFGHCKDAQDFVQDLHEVCRYGVVCVLESPCSMNGIAIEGR